ncbi:MAG: undecaprenyl-diphosphate phosphatase [bacterium]
MSIPQSVILGIIQGIAEWLPISSSGHLVIAQEFFGLQNSTFFDIMLHIATTMVVFAVFWNDIKEIIKALFKRDFKSEYGKLAIFIIIGSIPTGIIGILFHDTFEKMFSNLWAVALGLMITGILLFFTKRKTIEAGDSPAKTKELNTKKSLLIGVVQGIAIIPGISRSGSTISAGILAGVDRIKVARFSFLLSIPAILGALLLEAGKLKNLATNNTNSASILIGMVIAIIIGYISLKLLLKIIKLDKFYLFGYYCIILSFILLNILIFVK